MADDRYSPVHLEYKSFVNRTIFVKLPENYQASELPEPITIATEDGLNYFKMTLTQSGNTISISYQIAFTRLDIGPDEYPIFKTLYSLMIDKLNESLTLERI